MAFWILIAATVLLASWFFYRTSNKYSDWGDIGFGFVTAFLTLLTGALVGAGILALLSLIPTTPHIESQRYELRAIASGGESVSGEFFLGSGYINGERVVNYIKQVTDEDGTYSVIDSATGYAARIFEDSSEPYMLDYDWFYSNGWVIPFNVKTGDSWDFHVPAGSVLENYTIDNSQ